MNKVIARTYVRESGGETCVELIHDDGKYLVTRNGKDDSSPISSYEAARMWDRAGYRIGDRPEIVREK